MPALWALGCKILYRHYRNNLALQQRIQRWVGPLAKMCNWIADQVSQLPLMARKMNSSRNSWGNMKCLLLRTREDLGHRILQINALGAPGYKSLYHHWRKLRIHNLAPQQRIQQ